MLFSEVSPFIRFAEIIHYRTTGSPVNVRDCRIFYVLSGEAELTIDSQTYTLLPHGAFYCCAGSVYTISSAGMELISINFDLCRDGESREQPYSPKRLAAQEAPLWSGTCPVEDQPLLNGHIFLKEGFACRELLEEILTECSTKRLLYRDNAGALLKAVLVQLLRSNAENASQGAKVPEKIIDYIRSHYSEPLPNTLFSQMFGYHEYYLNRLFLKHTGSTIRQYVLDVRIGHAKKALLNTDLPLNAIAEAVGFNSNSYFSSYFRQSVGLSPAQFRKKYKNTL
jgi:AraC-like DNA-binding protein